MRDSDKIQTTGHTYDGIEEYDNPTPAWMTWIFSATFLFGIFYIFLHTLAWGELSPQAEYERAYLANLANKFGDMGTLEPDAATLQKYMADEEWLAFGETVFASNCTTCHGTNAGGNPAPNLTDDYYINIESIEDIPRVVSNGAAGGNMPAWRTRLHPNEVVLVSAYVASLRGTNVRGKAPEGDVPPPWGGEAPPSDEPAAE